MSNKGHFFVGAPLPLHTVTNLYTVHTKNFDRPQVTRLCSLTNILIYILIHSQSHYGWKRRGLSRPPHTPCTPLQMPVLKIPCVKQTEIWISSAKTPEMTGLKRLRSCTFFSPSGASGRRPVARPWINWPPTLAETTLTQRPQPQTQRAEEQKNSYPPLLLTELFKLQWNS